MDIETTLQTGGQIAYEGYRRSTGGRTYDGRIAPLWKELPMSIQHAWQTAAECVLRDALAGVIESLREVHAEMGL
ncbi:hypothetical protein [Deinococcus humi]|uniref:Uncharacterized protein n=1 Tax=Deinococcus humi TaxID=662880 RepID=A0A7W8JTP2_9DEIO|nr:hypothetical protein [Deinococcus humi]MBB5363067.1 hypothetical protein [Deinococcus humi]GGO24876.1 hypothetical protein GCM10008949_14180 [Deinococcus humi]